MTEESIKDIVIALIQTHQFECGKDNKETAREVAKFINIVRDRVKPRDDIE